MELIETRDLISIRGGGVNASLINAISRLISTVVEWGRVVGSTIYRYQNKNYCR